MTTVREPEVDLGLASDRHRKPTLRENFQHRSIFRQDLCDQFVKPGRSRNDRQMTHEERTDTPSLIVIDHGEGHLGDCRPNHHVASAAGDNLASRLLGKRQDSDMLLKIDIQEEVSFCSEKLRLTVKKRR